MDAWPKRIPVFLFQLQNMILGKEQVTRAGLSKWSENMDAHELGQNFVGNKVQ